MLYTLPKLDYAYDALEPYIDAKTMEIHHSKHHQAYIDNLNKAISEFSLEELTLEELFNKMSDLPAVLRNNAGGHYNQSLFWKLISPNASKPSGKLLEAIDATFGSFVTFTEKFTAAAMSRFGSGWVWLFVNDEGALEIGTTPNQDNPLMLHTTIKGQPVLALDVWEHAYYLTYQNRRPDYVSQFWNIINWDFAEEAYANAKR